MTLASLLLIIWLCARPTSSGSAALIGALGNTASEDPQLCGRWLHHGYRMIYVPEATMYHAHRLTFRTFCRQHFNYGRGALLLQKIRRQQGWQLFKPDPRYYARLLRSSLYAGPIARVVSVVALLVTAQAATALGMATQWINQERRRIAGAQLFFSIIVHNL